VHDVRAHGRERRMQTSIFLARLIGPVFLVMGLGIFLNREGYRAMAREFLKSRALIYIAGLLALVPGIAMVLTHNVWVADWRVIITIFGWLAVIGGVIRILFPQQVTAMGEKMLASDGYMTGAAIGVLALGAVLSFFGYLA
jgi:uncharacterized membrane protein